MSRKRIFFNTEETVTTTKKGWAEVELDFTQIYDTFTEIAVDIKSATTFKLLFWLLANKMSDENGIVCDSVSFNEFNKYLGEKCKEDCSINYRTYLRAIKELSDVGALTKVQKGHYYANPHLFWGGDKQDRLDFLVLEAKDSELQSLNPIIEIK
jgi:hypothetical protein